MKLYYDHYMKRVTIIFFLTTSIALQTYGTARSISLGKNFSDTVDQTQAVTTTLVQAFLAILEQEEYKVLTYQRILFHQFEKILEYIDTFPIKNLDNNAALLFALAFQKGANIYRRIADENSLTLALYYHIKALEIKAQWLDDHSLELAHSLADIGATYNEMKGIANNIQALEYYHRALKLYEHHGKEAQHLVASTLHKLGNATRDLDEANICLAIDYLQRALKIFDSLPNDAYVAREKAKVLYNQGVNYHHLGNKTNIKKAIKYLYEAKTLFELNNDQARSAMTLSYLGDVYRSLGNNSKAINCLHQALCKQKELFDKENSDIAITLYYLAMAYYESNEDEAFEKSQQYASKALEIQKKILSKTHPDIARTLYHVGLLHIEKKEFDSGIPFIKEALAIFKLLSPNHYYVKMVRESFKKLIEMLKECDYQG